MPEKSKQKKKENKSFNAKDKHRPKKPVLGKGLGALLPNIEFSDRGFKISDEDKKNIESGNFALIDISKIVQNPYQPRKEFDRKALEDLSNSIKENGVIQAITVRRSINGYELISGERRLRASAMAGFKKIPAYILEVKSDIDLLQIALIENLQREDLNPIETANGYQRLLEECNLTQEQVASKIGKDRSTITNFLRLLKLPEKIQESLRKHELSMGHARALLSINDRDKMLIAWKEIIKKRLSVRATETLARKIASGKIDFSDEKTLREKEYIRKDGKSDVSYDTALVLRDYENKLRHIFGTQVKIQTKSKESGQILFDFYSKNDFERLIELFEFIGSKV
jgi:ParB family transcriptional regulator, chromosome partitioning protein